MYIHLYYIDNGYTDIPILCLWGPRLSLPAAPKRARRCFRFSASSASTRGMEQFGCNMIMGLCCAMIIPLSFHVYLILTADMIFYWIGSRVTT